jgi:hypothetical protein
MTKKGLKMVLYEQHNNWNDYPHAGFMFAFCGKVEKGETKQLTGFEGCREGLTCYIFDRSSYKIQTSRLRCLVRTISVENVDKRHELFEKQTNAGLRILNIMEKHNGWPLTKMQNVETRITEALQGYRKRTMFIKMLDGSSKWMRSPHTLSLFFLLFRLSARNSAFLKVENYEQFKQVCKTYIYGTATSGDKRNVRGTIQFWDPLMAKFDQMFKGTSIESNYDKSGYTESYYSEGILKLCTFKTQNKELSKRFTILASDVKGAKVPKSKKAQAGL